MIIMYKIIPKENNRSIDSVESVRETDCPSNILGKIIVSDPSTIIILKNPNEVKNFYYNYNRIYHEAIFTTDGLTFLEKKFVKLPVDYVSTTFCVYRTPPFHLVGKKVVNKEKDIHSIEKAIDEDNAYVFDCSILQRKFMNLNETEFLEKDYFVGIKHLQGNPFPHMRLLQIDSTRHGNYDIVTTEIKFDSRKLDKSIHKLHQFLSPKYNETLVPVGYIPERSSNMVYPETSKVFRKKKIY